jgi:hypothetical protein
MVKPFWKSKTVLFNAIMAAIMAGLGLPGVGASPELIGFVTAAGNFILRFLTKEPVGVK